MQGISSESIENSQLGYKVEARIFLQDIDNDGRAGRQVRELQDWASFTTSTSVQGPGSASITLVNTFDRFFRNKYERRYGQGARAQEDSAITQTYLKDILGRFGDKVRYLNPLRREEAFGTNRFALRRSADDYINFMRDLLANSGPKQGADALPGDAVDLGLLQRVFIDIVGRDGKVYAAFTGLMSTIIDSSPVGGVATVTLTCKDYWRLFQLSEIIMKEAPGFNQLDETIALDVQDDLGTENYYGNSIFDGMTGIDVVKNLVKIMQSTFCADVYTLQKLRAPATGAAVGSEAFATSLAKNRDTFFYQDRFFDLDDSSSLVATFDGNDALRVVKDAVTSVPVTIRGQVFGAGETVPGRKPGDGIKDGDLIAQLTSEVLVDRAITLGPQAEVYRKVIERILSPFQAQRSRGDVILRKVAESTMYEVFFDTNGNLIYQIPRRNNFPGEYDPNIQNVTTAIANTAAKTTVEPVNAEEEEFPLIHITPSGTSFAPQTATYDFTNAGDWDYSPPGEELPQKGHGFNYVISDLSLKGWDLILSEEPIVTNVRTPTGFDLVNFSEVISGRFLTGITRLADVAHLQRRFGVRSVEIAKLFLPRFMSVEQQSGQHRSIDDTYALAVMATLNAGASNGNITLTSRPDLRAGKNILMLERQRLYEIQIVNQTVKQGGEAATTLVLSYGHDIGERIPNPWVAIEPDVVGQVSQPNVGATSPTIAANQPADPNLLPGDQVIAINPTSGKLLLPGGRASLNKNYGLIRGAENPWAQGPKDFTVNSNGTVTLTNAFIAENITQVTVPTSSGGVLLAVNKRLKSVFTAVFGEIAAAFRVRPEFVGFQLIIGQAFLPRFTAYNATYPHQLSTHTWGVAVDVYVVPVGTARPVYHLGQELPKNKLLVPFFNKYGFVWGGTFRGARDDIHFQFAKTDGKDASVNEPSFFE